MNCADNTQNTITEGILGGMVDQYFNFHRPFMSNARRDMFLVGRAHDWSKYRAKKNRVLLLEPTQDIFTEILGEVLPRLNEQRFPQETIEAVSRNVTHQVLIGRIRWLKLVLSFLALESAEHTIRILLLLRGRQINPSVCHWFAVESC